MGAASVEREPKFIWSLEGIRGYGFLAVFFTHYIVPSEVANPKSPIFTFCTVLRSPAFFAVPMFFVLSGFLIGGILFETRTREGYFRVFYSRRILRVFPVYYLALLGVACVDVVLRYRLDFRFWSYFVYAQSLVPTLTRAWYDNPVVLGHFWSLAVEEQFYLIWPLVVWFFPARRKLLSVVILLIAACWALRVASPLLGVSDTQMLYFTPTRADGILLGVLLALAYGNPTVQKARPLAKWLALAGVLSVALRAGWRGNAWPVGHLGTEILLPMVNLTAVAIVVAAMEGGSWFASVCSKKWICWLGSRSYSLYIVHFMFYSWFRNFMVPALSRHMKQSLANVVGALVVAVIALICSMLSYRYLETPAMKMKKYIKYGPRTPNRTLADKQSTNCVASGS